MARFDLHRRAGGYVVDVQSDLIPNMGTRLVIPLFAASAVPQAMKRLHPVIDIDGVDYVVATHLMGAVRTVDLGAAVGSLDEHYDKIVAALDMIFLGF